LKIIRSFEHEVEEHEHVWIPMRDGTRLAARIWRPAGAGRAPVPAIVEYIPYRKRDLTADRDALTHAYFAGHGYACVRVDLRGSGESEGVLCDEYTQQELDDGVEVLAWIAAQPWCDGSIGMIGISWGGFNGLQIAAMQPPELKAVITVCSTDDRYADDVHYMGGCLLTENLSWASTMFAHNTCPPDPELVDGWREKWLARLDANEPWLETWLRHPHRDAYWKHGSICEAFSDVRCPVYAVSGWADGYSNAVFRLVANLPGPRKGLIGPWCHKYPHLGVPGPAIDFLREALRWWDRWLKGIETGIMDEPMLRVWMQESVPPRPAYDERPGYWVAESRWPSPRIEPRVHPLARNRIAGPGEVVEEEALAVRSPLWTGLWAGKWCSYADAPDLPRDQANDAGGSLVFDSPPLDEPLRILGAPAVELELECDRPVAMVAVRLIDVAPDDRATRISYGLLNLTQRESREHPQPLEPGQRYRVRVQMNDIAQVVPAGHRVRVAVSSSYWPLAWPSPEPVRLVVYTGASSVELPLRPPSDDDARLPDLGTPTGAAPLAVTRILSSASDWRILHDDERSEVVVHLDEGGYRIDGIDLELGCRVDERYTCHGDDHDSVRGETRWERSFARGAWKVRTVTHTVLSSTREHFRIEAELEAFENEQSVFHRRWDRKLPRKLV